MVTLARELAFCTAVLGWLVVPSLAEDNEFKAIFNGKDLSGWRGAASLWSVKDGAITGQTTPEAPLDANTFLIWDQDVANFELTLDYKITGQNANSGIQYRSAVLDEAKFIVGGYQADIDATLTFAGINYEERGRGKLVEKRGERVTIDKAGKMSTEVYADAAELGKKIKQGDWNSYRVVAQGNKLSHFINDELMSEVIDNQEGKSAAKGVLALQLHRGPPMVVQFKNVRIKTLD